MAPYMEQVRTVIDDASFVDLCTNNDVYLQVEGPTLDYIVAVGPRGSKFRTLRVQALSDQSNLDCIGGVVTSVFMEEVIKITTQVPYGRELVALEAAGFKVAGELSYELLTDGSLGNMVILEIFHPRLIEARMPVKDEPQGEIISPVEQESVIEPTLKVIRLGDKNGEEEKRQEERLLEPLPQGKAPFDQKTGRQALPGGLGFDEITFERR
jgi:hypothetical protein